MKNVAVLVLMMFALSGCENNDPMLDLESSQLVTDADLSYKEAGVTGMLGGYFYEHEFNEVAYKVEVIESFQEKQYKVYSTTDDGVVMAMLIFPERLEDMDAGRYYFPYGSEVYSGGCSGETEHPWDIDVTSEVLELNISHPGSKTTVADFTLRFGPFGGNEGVLSGEIEIRE